MRIKNMLGFSIYLPYAGEGKSGSEIGTGAKAVSRELPPERFHHPLLQRDWASGRIEILLDEKDKVVLGDIVGLLEQDTVTVSVPAETPAAPPAIPPVPVAVQVPQATLPVVPAAEAIKAGLPVPAPAVPKPPVVEKKITDSPLGGPTIPAKKALGGLNDLTPKDLAAGGVNLAELQAANNTVTP